MHERESSPFGHSLTPNIARPFSIVHQIFPRVELLDGQTVTPIVQLPDGEDDVVEPPIRPGFYGPENVRQLVEQFLFEYYKAYDGIEGGTTRPNTLGAAYDETMSQFTLSIGNLDRGRFESVVFEAYVRQQHNILREDTWSRTRQHRTSRGALSIVNTLSKLPITRHLMESFTVDVSMVTSKLMCFTVQGLFEDGTFAPAGTPPILRYFSRAFIVAPRGEGVIVILNDALYVSALTDETVARYKNILDKAIANGPAVQPITSNLSTDQKREMVLQLSRETNLKHEWSEKCLTDNEWNIEEARQMFNSLRASIPPEAFLSAV